MAKTWVANKLDVYFEDIENEKTIRKGFNQIIENPSDDQLSSFANAVGNLYKQEKTHTILNQSFKIN
ncbi:MAG TPA: hypothetical protein VK107_05135 [Alloiococcus sp.]|nr:hypothetical protein [Alloiococcus sp.]